jgi:Na+/melibiose symporter-like transporter
MRIATRALIADGFARLSLHSSFTALLVLTFQGTTRSLDLGVVSAAMLLPALVFTIYSGRLMQRWLPLRTFQGATLLRVLALALAPLAEGSLPGLALLAGAVGLFQQALSAAKLTFDATVVPAEERARYNSKRAFLSGLAVLVGPSLAGLVAGWFGAGPAVLLSAGMGLLSFLALCRADYRPVVAEAAPEQPGGNVREELGAMLRWLWRSEQLGLLVVAYIVLVAILEMEAPLIFPFVKVVYERGPDVSGTLLGICGLGSLGGAFLMHRRNKPLSSRALTTLLLVDGLLLFLIACGPAVWLLYLLFSLLGVVSSVTQVTVETQVQNEAPPRYHPTLFSSMAFTGGAGGASLALATAALADVVGPARVLMYCAGLEIGVGLLATSLATLALARVAPTGVNENG